jgi:hypothetical protein
LIKRKRRRRENKELNQMTKSQRKAKTISFETSKTWSPKTWAMARRNQVKHGYSSRRGNELNTTSKAQKTKKLLDPLEEAKAQHI